MIKRFAKKLLWTYYRIHTVIRAKLINIEVGRGTIIHPSARIIKRGGHINIGRNCEILAGSVIANHQGTIKIGDQCSLNYYAILYGHGGLEIGNKVRIAAHSVVIPANHSIDPDAAIHDQPLSKKGIFIGDDVWLGARATILDGVRVESGCVIAAGAVVTGGTVCGSMSIYGGVPAKKIGARNASKEDM